MSDNASWEGARRTAVKASTGRGSRWSEPEHDRIRGWVATQIPVREMAAELHRSEGAVRDRIRRLYDDERIRAVYGCYPNYVLPWEGCRRTCKYRTPWTPDFWTGEPRDIECYDFAEPTKLVCDKHSIFQEMVAKRRVADAGKYRVQTFADIQSEYANRATAE